MNIPYTYLIGWSSLNKWYYGVRYAKNCHPLDLWNPYKTSSRLVSNFIKENGDPDIRIIRKTFDSVDKARCWENRVLTKLNVINNNCWINGHNTIAFDSSLVPRGDQHWTKKNPEKWEAILKKRNNSSEQDKKLWKMPSGDNHWTRKTSDSSTKHLKRMNGNSNPNNFLHNKLEKSKRLKIDNPINLPGVKNKISKTLTGYKHPRKVCEHCRKNVADSGYTRWHGDKCKNKI